MNTDAPAAHSPLTRFVLPLAIAATLAACGGGGSGGDDNNPPPPPPPVITVADAQFAVEKIDGLGFRGNGITEGRTDATGKLEFGVGQTVEFFLGEGANKLVLGSATVAPAANNGVASIGLKDLSEAATAPTFLDNVISLLVSLDANSDVSDGITIDAAANTAVANAIAGKTLNFTQASDAFKADPVIAALFTALNRTFLDAQTALADFSTLFPQGRSSSIALTSDNTRVVVANRQKSSVSIIRVRAANGADAKELLAELTVDKEPRFVAISPDDKRAYVTSAVGGTMSVIDLTATPKPVLVGEPVFVGLEPRGIALTPNGKHAFVALHTTGDVAAVDLTKLETNHIIHTGGNPQAVAITNDGDNDDLDERVFVTRMFGELIDPARPDGFDDAKQGIVDTFSVASAVNGAGQVAQIKLLPLASGFNADRRQFCEITRGLIEGTEIVAGAGPLILFNSGPNGDLDVNDQLANPTFCPNTASADVAAGGEIGRVAQKVYPNMLFASLIRGRKLYVPNEGASPEPPVRFNVNVQALVGVIDRTQGGVGVEDTNLSLNLNTQVAKEAQPAEADARNTFDRVFLNDTVAVDADRSGRNFLFVSRGGNYVVRAGLDAAGKLTILDAGTPPKAQRLQTGNVPTGVVMSSDGTRAYANNEINTSVTALDLANNTVLERDIESSTPPAPGTQEHRNLVGKLVFFTALGVPDVLDTNGDGQFDIALRDIDPLKHRGKASDNGWSSCSSCHDDGHSDNVTWIFEVGPRQTIALEGMFTHDVPDVAGRLLDQRALNWSAVRGSNTDFNQNAIGIQGGTGFAKETATGNRSALVFNHGPVFGVSDSLDALQEWVTTVRAPIVPILANSQPGRVVFEQHCASCHGGAKWTKSQVTQLFALAPATNSGLDATFPENPLGANFFTGGVAPFDASLAVNGPQLLSVTRGGSTLKLLDDVGTFFGPATAEGKLEIRGAAAIGAVGSPSGVQSTQGFGAFGLAGFNSPSLLGLSMSAPYFHDGSAQTLEDVMAKHRIEVSDGNGGTTKVTIQTAVTAQQLSDLLNFVRTIEDETPPVDSATDAFLEQNPLP